MSAKLSSTLAGIAILECAFPPLVFGPVLFQRSVSRPPLEDTSPLADERRGHRFEENPLGCRLHHGLGSVLDFELFAKAKRDDDLPFRGEPYRLDFVLATHA